MNSPFDIIATESLVFQERQAAARTLLQLFYRWMANKQTYGHPPVNQDLQNTAFDQALVLAEEYFPDATQFNMNKLVGLSYIASYQTELYSPFLLSGLHYYMLSMPGPDKETYYKQHKIPIHDSV